MAVTPIPNAPVVPQYPALGSPTFNEEAYAYATAMPGVTQRTHEIALASKANAEEAKVQAETATTKAGEAKVQAETATTKAGEASASAASALASANSAAASYDSFDDRYLGSKASDPVKDNDGQTLLEGALYWNTKSKNLRVWNGTSWQVAQLTDAPNDSGAYARKSGAWVELDTSALANVGSAPGEVPSNQHLGALAFLDTLGATQVTQHIRASRPGDVWYEWVSNTKLTKKFHGFDNVIRTITETYA